MNPSQARAELKAQLRTNLEKAQTMVQVGDLMLVNDMLARAGENPTRDGTLGALRNLIERDAAKLEACRAAFTLMQDLCTFDGVQEEIEADDAKEWRMLQAVIERAGVKP